MADKENIAVNRRTTRSTRSTRSIALKDSTSVSSKKLQIVYFGEKDEEIFAIGDSDTVRKQRVAKMLETPLDPGAWWDVLGTDPEPGHKGPDGWKLKAFKRAEIVLGKSEDNLADSDAYFNILITLAELQISDQPRAARMLLKQMLRKKVGIKRARFYTTYAPLEKDLGTLMAAKSLVTSGLKIVDDKEPLLKLLKAWNGGESISGGEEKDTPTQPKPVRKTKFVPRFKSGGAMRVAATPAAKSAGAASDLTPSQETANAPAGKSLSTPSPVDKSDHAENDSFSSGSSLSPVCEESEETTEDASAATPAPTQPPGESTLTSTGSSSAKSSSSKAKGGGYDHIKNWAPADFNSFRKSISPSASNTDDDVDETVTFAKPKNKGEHNGLGASASDLDCDYEDTVKFSPRGSKNNAASGKSNVVEDDTTEDKTVAPLPSQSESQSQQVRRPSSGSTSSNSSTGSDTSMHSSNVLDDTDSDMSCGDTICFKQASKKTEEETITFAKRGRDTNANANDLDDTDVSMSSSGDDRTVAVELHNRKKSHQRQHHRHHQQPSMAVPRQIADSFSFLDARNMLCVNGKAFLKLAVIGRGGSSKVFKVMGTDSEMYALKRIKLHKTDPDALASYTNEIELLKRLQGSRHIVRMVESQVDVQRGEILVVMEIGEIDLNNMLQKMWEREKGKGKGGGEGDEKQRKVKVNQNFLRMTWQHMLEAVHSIHEARVVHGDLKPANFLFVNGTLKLIDFGIAKTISDNTTNISRDSQVGTLNYMCPEAILDTSQRESMGYSKVSSSSVDPAKPCLKLGRASDIWSLGCILYQMVYGRTPFAHLNVIQKLQQIVDPSRPIHFADCGNPLLVDVIARCLERDPQKRMTIPQLLEHPFLSPPAAAAPTASDSGAVCNACTAGVDEDLVRRLVAIGWDRAGGDPENSSAALSPKEVAAVAAAVNTQLRAGGKEVKAEGGEAQSFGELLAAAGFRSGSGNRPGRQTRSRGGIAGLGAGFGKELAARAASRTSDNIKNKTNSSGSIGNGSGGGKQPLQPRMTIGNDLKSQIASGHNRLKKAEESGSARFMKAKNADASSPAPGDLRGALEKGLLSRFKNIPNKADETQGFDQTWTFSSPRK